MLPYCVSISVGVRQARGGGAPLAFMIIRVTVRVKEPRMNRSLDEVDRREGAFRSHLI